MKIHSPRLTVQMFLLALLLLPATGCKIGYSLSGASISPDVKSVFVDYYRNRSRVINPTLSQTFTEAMKDKFVNETGLSLNSEQADLELRDKPVSLTNLSFMASVNVWLRVGLITLDLFL